MAESSSNRPPLLDQFLACLRELPNAHVEAVTLEIPSAGARADAELNLSLGGQSILLLVEVKKLVFPRDVRQSIWQLRSLSQGREPTRHPVIIAESLSPGAKELLRAEHIGYFDSGGSLYLMASGAYVHIDKPAPKTWQRTVRSLFSGRRAQVLHVLLEHHRDWFGVKELANRAQVAPSTASEVLSELERFEWVTARGLGPAKERQLREPGKLLDAWVKQLETERPTRLRRYFVPGLKIDALLTRLAEAFESSGLQYAVTHEAAAQRYAPFLSVVSQARVRIAPRSNLQAALKEMSAHEVSEGANLALMEAKSSSELQLRQQHGGVWFASPVQVYLDLVRSEGRGREMASRLREEVIRF